MILALANNLKEIIINIFIKTHKLVSYQINFQEHTKKLNQYSTYFDLKDSNAKVNEILDTGGKVSTKTVDKIIADSVRRETKNIKSQINTLKQKTLRLQTNSKNNIMILLELCVAFT